MCKCISKTYLDKILTDNNIPYSNIQFYIMGSNKISNWQFSKEMDREGPLPKNVENKIINFLKGYGLKYDENKMWVDYERRGRNQSHTGDRHNASIYVDNTINPSQVSQRLKDMGWKISTVGRWFGASDGKFNNILHKHAKYVSKKDWFLLAYFCRCKDTQLTIGFNGKMEFTDSEFHQASDMKAEYYLKPEMFEMLTDEEISKLLKSVGIPCYFFNEMLEQRLPVPKALAEQINKVFNKVSNSDYGFGDNISETILVIDREPSKEEKKVEEKSEKKTANQQTFEEIAKRAEEIMEKHNEIKPVINFVSEDQLPEITPAQDIVEIIMNYARQDKISAANLRDIAVVCNSLAEIADAKERIIKN